MWKINTEEANCLLRLFQQAVFNDLGKTVMIVVGHGHIVSSLFDRYHAVGHGSADGRFPDHGQIVL